ncbi:hypothetical protein PCE1_001973 [Barthelona sp. PCE]
MTSKIERVTSSTFVFDQGSGDPEVLSESDRERFFGFSCPSIIEFRNWEPGGEYIFNLPIKNVAHHLQRIRFKLPKHPTLELPFPDPVRLASGRLHVFPLKFRPIKMEPVKDFIEFKTERGSFFIKAVAYTPRLSFTIPSDLEFGFVSVNETETIPVTISNDGQVDLHYNIKIEEPFSVDKPVGIVPSESKMSVYVSFSPKKAFSHLSKAVFKVKGADSVEIALKGIGKYPFLICDEKSIDFGEVVSETSKRAEVLLSNPTEVTVNWKAVKFDGDYKTPFFVTPAYGSIPPRSDQTVHVTFLPQWADLPLSTTVDFQLSSGVGPKLVLKGDVVPAVAQLEPDLINFGQVHIGASVTRQVVLHNHSTMPITWTVADPSSVFKLSQTTGVVDRKSYTCLVVNFTCEKPIQHYSKVDFIVHGGQTVTLHMLCTGYCNEVRPPPLLKSHYSLTPSFVINQNRFLMTGGSSQVHVTSTVGYKQEVHVICDEEVISDTDIIDLQPYGTIVVDLALTHHQLPLQARAQIFAQAKSQRHFRFHSGIVHPPHSEVVTLVSPKFLVTQLTRHTLEPKQLNSENIIQFPPGCDPTTTQSFILTNRAELPMFYQIHDVCGILKKREMRVLRVGSLGATTIPLRLNSQMEAFTAHFVCETPDIECPNPVFFPTTCINSEGSCMIPVSNKNAYPLKITVLDLSDEFSCNKELTLYPYEHTELEMFFKPTVSGRRQFFFTMMLQPLDPMNGVEVVEKKISVWTRTANAELSVDPTELDFGYVEVRTTRKMEFIVVNSSDSIVKFQTTVEDSTLQLESTEHEIAANSRYPIAINWNPVTVGKWESEVCIILPGKSDILKYTVKGEGVFPRVEIVDFRSFDIPKTVATSIIDVQGFNNKLAIDRSELRNNKIDSNSTVVQALQKMRLAFDARAHESTRFLFKNSGLVTAHCNLAYGEELSLDLVSDATDFMIRPTKFSLEPGESQEVTMNIHPNLMDSCWHRNVSAMFSVKNGAAIPLEFNFSNLTNVEHFCFIPSTVHALPVPLAISAPFKQYIPVYNPSHHDIKVKIDPTSIESIKEENYGFQIFKFPVDPIIVPAESLGYIEYEFLPIEIMSYILHLRATAQPVNAVDSSGVSSHEISVHGKGVMDFEHQDIAEFEDQQLPHLGVRFEPQMVEDVVMCSTINRQVFEIQNTSKDGVEWYVELDQLRATFGPSIDCLPRRGVIDPQSTALVMLTYHSPTVPMITDINLPVVFTSHKLLDKFNDQEENIRRRIEEEGEEITSDGHAMTVSSVSQKKSRKTRIMPVDAPRPSVMTAPTISSLLRSKRADFGTLLRDKNGVPRLLTTAEYNVAQTVKPRLLKREDCDFVQYFTVKCCTYTNKDTFADIFEDKFTSTIPAVHTKIERVTMPDLEPVDPLVLSLLPESVESNVFNDVFSELLSQTLQELAHVDVPIRSLKIEDLIARDRISLLEIVSHRIVQIVIRSSVLKQPLM